MNERMKTGRVVAFFDAWQQQRKTGTVIEVRRSLRNPWKVAVVRLNNGSEVEVHPDRLESDGEK